MTLSTWTRRWFLAFMALGFGSPALAESLTLKDGKWEIAVVPGNAADVTAGELFTGVLSEEGFQTSWTIFRFDTSIQQYAELASLDENLEPGEGFWIIQIEQAEVVVEMPAGILPPPTVTSEACPASARCVELDLPSDASRQTWIMMGAPFATDARPRDFRVRSEFEVRPGEPDADCSLGCALSDAFTASLTAPNVFTYDSETGEYVSVLDVNAELPPWKGFWFATAETLAGESATLLIPDPGSTPATVNAPSLTGLERAAIGPLVSSAGLILGDVTVAPSDSVAAGRVVSQVPSAGASVDFGSVLSVVVSSGGSGGEDFDVVPDARGVTEAEAIAILTRNGFTAGDISMRPSADVASGLVTSQSPPVGRLARRGSAVALVLSSGASDSLVAVPNLLGSTRGAAEDSIESSGFAVGDIGYEASDAVPLGQVMRQSPGVGVERPPGSSVSLTVSSGNIEADVFADVPVPSLVGLGQEEAEQALRDGNLLVGTVTLANSTTVEPGKIISQSIATDDPTRIGSPVNLIVSAGDGGLAVRIASPESLSTVGTPVLSIAGTASPAEARLTVNGIEVAHADGAFAASVALQEGHNAIVASLEYNGVVLTDSISVSLDRTAPNVTIESPVDGEIIYADTVLVTGLINDIVRGTIEQSQATVTVNGIGATISNRSFSAEVPLAPGANALSVVGSDQVGNVGRASVTVQGEPTPARNVAKTGGIGQAAVIGEELGQPLAVTVTDADGNAVADERVVFRVTQGSGSVRSGTEGPARAVVVTTNADGVATARFRLGDRKGTDNQKVSAAVVGYETKRVFSASALGAEPVRLSVNSGNNQRGVVGQVLPEPLVVVATDSGGNVVEGAAVRFIVARGDGRFVDESASYDTTTDSDGRATVEYLVGSLQGTDMQRVTALLITSDFTTRISAGFSMSGFVPGPSGDTVISGVVLDNEDEPVVGVTMRLDGSPRQAVTDESGQFVISEAPVGPVHLTADGTSVSSGEYPAIGYDLVTIAGIDNELPAPIYMVQLDTENAVYAGSEDVVVTVPELPGFELAVAANSATFPDGSREGFISVTPVNTSKVPMPPPNGMQPQVIVTIQPAGTRFDPPAKLTLPNVDVHPPGAQVELYSFDHDLEQFVSIGLGTVTSDGSLIESNRGVGVVKAGWHCGSQPADDGCAVGSSGGSECGMCRRSASNDCSDGSCMPDDTQDPGECLVCQGGRPQKKDDELEDVECRSCANGVAMNDPNGAGCDDGLYCTSMTGAEPGLDHCENGLCIGKAIEDVEKSKMNVEVDLSELTKLWTGADIWDDLKIGSNIPVKPTGSFKGEIEETIVDTCCEDAKSIKEASVKKGSLGYSGTALGRKIAGRVVVGPALIYIEGRWSLNASGSGSYEKRENACDLPDSACLEKLEIKIDGKVAGRVLAAAYHPAVLNVSGTVSAGVEGRLWGGCANTSVVGCVGPVGLKGEYEILGTFSSKFWEYTFPSSEFCYQFFGA